MGVIEDGIYDQVESCGGSCADCESISQFYVAEILMDVHYD
jgi:hypothetical protein